jgi:hypothetical protein
MKVTASLQAKTVADKSDLSHARIHRDGTGLGRIRGERTLLPDIADSISGPVC